MDFIKDFINTLSTSSISFLLLSSIFAFTIYFNLLDGRLKSKAGSAFTVFGVLLLLIGLLIRPLLYLGIAYFLLMFVLARLGPRLWDTRVPPGPYWVQLNSPAGIWLPDGVVRSSSCSTRSRVDFERWVIRFT